MPVRPVFPSDDSSSTGAVNSVNGEQGDVIITAQDLNAQPASTVLTDIAAITMPDNSFLHTDGSGSFTPSLCMPAGVAWLSYTTVDQQKDHLALSEVASSGDYNDLINKPASISVPTKTSELTNDSGFITAGAIPHQVNSDWNSTSGKSQILNKPILFSGSYSDLTGKPTLFSGSYSDLTNKPTLFDGTYASLTGKPTTFTPTAHTHTIGDVTGLQSSLDSKLGVGASIPYSSLTGSPSIPAAQVNSDWTAVSGVSQVLNKPILATVATSGSYADLTNKPVIPPVNYPVTSVNTKVGAVVLTSSDIGAAASVHNHAINDITGLQSTLDSKASTASLSGYATTGALTTATTGLRKVETFLGTTDASGNLSITFANTYSTPPDVQPQLIGGTFNQMVRVVSVSNTGCVVQAAQRNLVTLLAVEVLLGATVNLAGANVTVQVTPRT